MAYSTSGAALMKCGPYVSTAITESMWNTWALSVDALINTTMRKNCSSTWTTYNAYLQPIFVETASSLMAIYAIQYDMSGYTSRKEAEDMITILRDNANKCLNLLQDKKVQDFLENGS